MEVTTQILERMVDKENEIVLHPGQLCIALDNFKATQAGDLDFTINNVISIIGPSDEMYWYIGRSSTGHIGVVPSNFLKPIEAVPPAVPPKAKAKKATPQDMGDYEVMGPAGAAAASVKPIKSMTKEERDMIRTYEREGRKRYASGTVVVATDNFSAVQAKDMSFMINDEMCLMKPMADLCWYFAKKLDNPSLEGAIPITHVRPVYMSDDEEEDEIYNIHVPKAGYDRLYDYRNDFISNSGWFQFPGFPLGKEALINVLAKEAGFSYKSFMDTKRSVYVLSFLQEKIFVGKADNLAEELIDHFESFGKKREQIREIDDELCHHTNSYGWKLTVYPANNLELEFNKRMIEAKGLQSKNKSGISEGLVFTSRDNFDLFWEWFLNN